MRPAGTLQRLEGPLVDYQGPSEQSGRVVRRCLDLRDVVAVHELPGEFDQRAGAVVMEVYLEGESVSQTVFLSEADAARVRDAWWATRSAT